MGEGDPKLAMFIGAFLGWRGALFALVAGSFQGIVAWTIARAAGARIGPEHRAATPPAARLQQAATTSRLRARARRRARRMALPGQADDASGRALPFGPFLALGAIEFLFFGERILDWYLSFFE